jgi:polar amino acid transport system substrate-binding protein
MKTIVSVALVAAALLGISTSGHAQDSVLRIGTEGAYPPFNNLTADGRLVGFDIDIAEALCAEMKVTCEIVTQDWDGMIPALQAGKFDVVIASMAITPERAEQVDFTNKYYNSPPGFAAPKDAEVTGLDPASLAGKTIGVQGSTTYFNHLTQEYTSSTIRPYPAPADYQLDLANGRLDLVNDDVAVLTQWLASPEGACCKLVGTIEPVVAIHGPGNGIAVRKGENELLERLNAALAAIRKDGRYKAINDKYFDFDIYGG